MERAHKRDAVHSQKFYWRKYTLANSIPDDETDEDALVELTIDEIINGGETFHGLLPLISNYLDTVCVDEKFRQEVQPYFDLISKRASGKLQTSATYIRNFVKKHPSYQHDSIVNETINYDLICHLHQICSGKLKPSELF